MNEETLNQILKVREEYNKSYKTWTPIYMTVREILEEDPKCISWGCISEQPLSFEFILHFVDYLHLDIVLAYSDLYEYEIEQIQHKFDKQAWLWLSFMTNLSEHFIEKHLDKLSLKLICKYNEQLSKGFIIRNFDILDLQSILKNGRISNDVKEYVRMFV